jgi:hypothetical protein
MEKTDGRREKRKERKGKERATERRAIIHSV